MFKDPKPLLEYYSNHNLGQGSTEYSVQLAFHLLYVEHDRDKAVEVLRKFPDQKNDKIKRAI